MSTPFRLHLDTTHSYAFDTIDAPWQEIHAALRHECAPWEDAAGEVPLLAETYGRPNPPDAAGPSLADVLIDGWDESLADA